MFVGESLTFIVRRDIADSEAHKPSVLTLHKILTHKRVLEKDKIDKTKEDRPDPPYTWAFSFPFGLGPMVLATGGCLRRLPIMIAERYRERRRDLFFCSWFRSTPRHIHRFVVFQKESLTAPAGPGHSCMSKILPLCPLKYVSIQCHAS